MGTFNIIYIYITLVIIIVVLLYLRIKRHVPKMKHGEILTVDEMKKKYKISSDNYKPPKINPEKVPENLRDLIPFAAKWGIMDDIIRVDFEEKASSEEKQEFKKALTDRTDEVQHWLDSFGSDLMPDEAAHFLFMLEGLDEMKLWPDLPQE